MERQRKKTTKQPTATVILGAGAPNAPLMSGFLAAVYEGGKTFNNFFTSGGGGLIGLSLVAPKEEDPLENVEGILNCAVADPIYRHLPVNYKVFRKNSPLMEPVQKMFNLFKAPASLIPSESGQRLYNDLVDLAAVMATPGGMPRAKDTSVCAPFALLPATVDFKKLETFTGQYYLNAYNIVAGKIEVFPKEELGPKHFIAGLSYPFIYPPGELNGNLYYEGADVDPMALFEFIEIMKHEDHRRHFPPGHTIVLVDILGALERAIVRPANGLWDAFGISMLTSIVASARWSKAYFRERFMVHEHKAKLHPDHHKVGHYDGTSVSYEIETDPGNPEEDGRHTFWEMRFDVPEAHWPQLMTWSYSNLSLCYQIGRETGRKWLADHGHLLPDRDGDTVNAAEA